MKIVRPEPKQKMSADAKKVFKGVIYDVYQWQQKQYDGSYKTFETIKRPDTVVIFPRIATGKFLTIREIQPGFTKPWFSLPVGRVEKQGDLVAEAKRELLEETGYKCDNFTFWYSHQPEAKIDWFVHCFIAKDCYKFEEIVKDKGEKVIELNEMSFDEIVELYVNNERLRGGLTVEKFLRARLDPMEMKAIKHLFLD